MTQQTIRWLKATVFLCALLPLVKLLLEAFAVGNLSLGANPVEELLHRCGIWALNFLLITLSISPLRQLTRRAWLLRFRRMLGLFAFFYALLHFLVYAILDQGLDVAAIVEDVVERPYITLGMTALLMLIPLAVTSTNAMMRRLGRRWRTLHRLVYAIAILGVWHFWWQVKADLLEPALYAIILASLLAFRIWSARK